MFFSAKSDILFGMATDEPGIESPVNESVEHENTITEYKPLTIDEALEHMLSFTVGDDPRWIAAKYCAQIQEGVNAYSRELGRCELNFAEAYREELLANPEFFNEEESSEDSADKKPEAYDVKKDRINKIKRRAKAVVQKIIAKVKDAINALISKIGTTLAKRYSKKLSANFMANIKKNCTKDEIEKASKQALTGQRLTVNNDLLKSLAIVNSNELFQVFQDYLDAKGDAIDYKDASSKATDSKSANKYAAASDKASQAGNDAIDKFDRKIMAKLVMVTPQVSSNTNLTIDLMTDETYNLNKIFPLMIAVSAGKLETAFEKARTEIDAKFTRMILSKEVEIEKHGNEGEINEFVTRANEIGQRYVKLFGDCSNSVLTYVNQCWMLLTKFAADLHVNPLTGEHVEVQGIGG